MTTFRRTYNHALFVDAIARAPHIERRSPERRESVFIDFLANVVRAAGARFIGIQDVPLGYGLRPLVLFNDHAGLTYGLECCDVTVENIQAKMRGAAK